MLSRTTTRLTAAAFGLIAAAAPLMGAGPDRVESRGWSFHPPKVFGRVNISFGHPRRPEPRHHAEEVVPCDLKFTAYQSRDTVIIIASGTNRSAGFTTAFTACDLDDRTPEIRLRNTSSCEPCAQVTTCFEVTSSFHSHRQLGCIKVRVANQCFDVRVTQVPCL